MNSQSPGTPSPRRTAAGTAADAAWEAWQRAVQEVLARTG